MVPNEFLFFAVPVAIYAALVLLPSPVGKVAAPIAFGMSSLFLLMSVTARPSSQYVDLGTFYQALFSMGVFGAVAGALGYVLATRKRNPSWFLRALFLVIAVAITGLIFLLYSGLR